ncbi:hypothetical protein EBT31_20255, partial [bacterium]|nr:hypothetical protein [bacterium]
DSSVAMTDVAVANPNATVNVTAPMVGGVGDVHINVLLSVDLDANDTIEVTFPSYMNVASAAFSRYSFGGSFTCSATGQVVTCTANGAIPGGMGTIYMTGITSYYAGTADITSFEIKDGGVAGKYIATDSSVAMTDIVALNRSTFVTIDSPTVGSTGNVALTLTLPVDLDSNDTIDITFPAYMNVASVAFASHNFGGGGAFTCAAVGQVVTCTANGAINAGSQKEIVMTGITSYYAGTADIAFLEVEDEGIAVNDIVIDSSIAMTDITAADAAASVVVASPTVGAVGNVTITLTLPVDLDADDTIDITFPAYMNVASVAFASETFGGAGTFSTCSDAGQVVTCTANGAITAGTGTIVMTGITSYYAGTTDITSFEVEDEGIAANDIATDSFVVMTNIAAADAAASVVVASPTVGAVGNVT